MRGMRNAYYARDNFDVRRGGRGFSCAVKNTLISQKDAVDTRTFRVKPNTPKLLSMPGKNGGQLWDLPSISMGHTYLYLIDFIAPERINIKLCKPLFCTCIPMGRLFSVVRLEAFL